MITENLVGSIVEFEQQVRIDSGDNDFYEKNETMRGTIVWIGTKGKYHSLEVLIKTENNKLYKKDIYPDKYGEIRNIKFIKTPKKQLTRPELMDLE